MEELEQNKVLVISLLKSYKRYLSQQEFRTMKGQCEAGSPEAAKKGLIRLLRKRGVLDEHDDL